MKRETVIFPRSGSVHHAYRSKFYPLKTSATWHILVATKKIFNVVFSVYRH